MIFFFISSDFQTRIFKICILFEFRAMQMSRVNHTQCFFCFYTMIFSFVLSVYQTGIFKIGILQFRAMQMSQVNHTQLFFSFYMELYTMIFLFLLRVFQTRIFGVGMLAFMARQMSRVNQTQCFFCFYYGTIHHDIFVYIKHLPSRKFGNNHIGMSWKSLRFSFVSMKAIFTGWVSIVAAVS